MYGIFSTGTTKYVAGVWQYMAPDARTTLKGPLKTNVLGARGSDIMQLASYVRTGLCSQEEIMIR